jgi:hypothetical protein
VERGGGEIRRFPFFLMSKGWPGWRAICVGTGDVIIAKKWFGISVIDDGLLYVLKTRVIELSSLLSPTAAHGLVDIDHGDK